MVATRAGVRFLPFVSVVRTGCFVVSPSKNGVDLDRRPSDGIGDNTRKMPRTWAPYSLAGHRPSARSMGRPGQLLTWYRGNANSAIIEGHGLYQRL